MFLSKRALSKAYHLLDRNGQRELIEAEKKLDDYAVRELRTEIERKKKIETSVLIEVRELPTELLEFFKGLESRLRIRIFVRSFEEDVKVNQF